MLSVYHVAMETFSPNRESQLTLSLHTSFLRTQNGKTLVAMLNAATVAVAISSPAQNLPAVPRNPSISLSSKVLRICCLLPPFPNSVTTSYGLLCSFKSFRVRSSCMCLEVEGAMDCKAGFVCCSLHLSLNKMRYHKNTLTFNYLKNDENYAITTTSNTV